MIEKYVKGTEILDSGNRKEFSSGAVRDLEEGKGRFDLLPCQTLQLLAEVASYWDISKLVNSIDQQTAANIVMDMLCVFGYTQSMETFRRATLLALHIFSLPDEVSKNDLNDREYLISLIKVKILRNPKISFRNVPFEGLRRVAEHFRKGALKYSSRNWEKGMHLSRFRSSAMRHLMQFIHNMNDEPHLDAAVWNLVCYIETFYNIQSRKISTEFIGDEYVLSEMKLKETLTPHNIFDD